MKYDRIKMWDAPEVIGVISHIAILYFAVGRSEGSVAESKLVVVISILVVVVEDELSCGSVEAVILRIPGTCTRELDLAFRLKN